MTQIFKQTYLCKQLSDITSCLQERLEFVWVKYVFFAYNQIMNNYVNLVKSWYQTGQEYINTYTENNKKKAAFIRIDKAATIYDARGFHSLQLETLKCMRTLTNLIYLFNQGEHFSEDEGTQLFFAITKLLQSEDASLRRLVYVSVKEMRAQSSIYIVTSSLLKDIHHKNPNFRRNSLRTIPLIIDASNLMTIERYIKALIVDPDVGVSSSALLSGVQMFQTNEELVKKWGSEILEKLSSKDPYVQCHALMLLGDTKRKDINSYKKILFSLTKNNLTGIAAVQYLRMLREITADMDCQSSEAKDFVNYVLKEVRNREDMVQIEACKLACESSLLSNKELLEVVRILESFLVSDSTVKKYSVLKIFNSLLKNQYRKSLIVNVKEIEKVLNDSNTSLSSIAASILLRICSEAYLETLFTRIEKTMHDMSVEYKKDVVNSLTNVLKTYPAKYDLINKFLLNIIRREESPDIKSAVIAVMNYEITDIGGNAKAECIRELTRLLSATTYHRVHFQILGIISREAGTLEIGSEIFKNIISEIYLQEGAVRACGLSTLIRLAEHEKKQRDALEKTIEQFKNDASPEVRERLVFRQREKPLSGYELDIIEQYLQVNESQLQESTDPNLLNMDNIKKWGAEAGSQILKGKTAGREVEVEKAEADEYQTYRDIFANHPTFKDYGTLRKINKAVQLSDAESELQVNLRLFLFDQSFIAEFKVGNRQPNSVLENVKIELKHSGEIFEVAHIIPAKQIAFGQSVDCFVGLRRSEECEDVIAEEKFSAVARFTVKEMAGDQVKKTYQDEFSLQSFEIKLASYMAQWVFEPSDFAKTWEKMKGFEQNGTFQLKYASTQAAEQELIRHFGLKKLESSQNVGKGNMVAVNLAGRFLGSKHVLVVLMLAFDTKMGCLLKIKVKTEDEQLTDELVQSIS